MSDPIIRIVRAGCPECHGTGLAQHTERNPVTKGVTVITKQCECVRWMRAGVSVKWPPHP